MYFPFLFYHFVYTHYFIYGKSNIFLLRDELVLFNNIISLGRHLFSEEEQSPCELNASLHRPSRGYRQWESSISNFVIRKSNGRVPVDSIAVCHSLKV